MLILNLRVQKYNKEVARVIYGFFDAFSCIHPFVGRVLLGTGCFSFFIRFSKSPPFSMAEKGLGDEATCDPKMFCSLLKLLPRHLTSTVPTNVPYP